MKGASASPPRPLNAMGCERTLLAGLAPTLSLAPRPSWDLPRVSLPTVALGTEQSSGVLWHCASQEEHGVWMAAMCRCFDKLLALAAELPFIGKALPPAQLCSGVCGQTSDSTWAVLSQGAGIMHWESC